MSTSGYILVYWRQEKCPISTFFKLNIVLCFFVQTSVVVSPSEKAKTWNGATSCSEESRQTLLGTICSWKIKHSDVP